MSSLAINSTTLHSWGFCQSRQRPQRQITRICGTREVHLCWSIVERAEQLGTSGISAILIRSSAVITDESMDAMTGRAGVIDYSMTIRLVITYMTTSSCFRRSTFDLGKLNVALPLQIIQRGSSAMILPVRHSCHAIKSEVKQRL